MTPDELARLHPRLYHVTEQACLPSIERNGLLTVADIASRAGLTIAEKAALLARRRPDKLPLDVPGQGLFILNDHKPLHEGKLRACLDDGLTPADWCRMLAERLFFWVDEKEAAKLAGARGNRGRGLATLVFDTRTLAHDYSAHVEITPINTGATIRKPPRRGLHSFTPIRNMPYEDWRVMRQRMGLVKSPDSIREVVLTSSIPSIKPYLLTVIA